MQAGRAADQICLPGGKSPRAVAFRHRVCAGINWARSYFTYDKGSRLIIRKYSRQGAEKTSRIEKIETR